MISAVLLMTYGVAMGTWGAANLREADWPQLTPRLAIAAWQALSISVLMSLIAAGAALSVSFQHIRSDLARLLNLCAQNLAHGYAAPGGAVLGFLGVGIAILLLTRTLWCTGLTLWRDRVNRRRRVAMLDLVGRHDIVQGALVVDHDQPYAFCIGGREHRVVLTSALVATLPPGELDAVLAHEASHLRQRHHLALLICRSLFASLAPFFPTFRTAMTNVALYAEFAADDQARRDVGAEPLRVALTRLACLPTPAGTLAASGEAVVTRLERLDDSPTCLDMSHRIAAATTIAAMVLLPLAVVAAPMIALAWEGICLMS